MLDCRRWKKNLASDTRYGSIFSSNLALETSPRLFVHANLYSPEENVRRSTVAKRTASRSRRFRQSDTIVESKREINPPSSASIQVDQSDIQRIDTTLSISSIKINAKVSSPERREMERVTVRHACWQARYSTGE